MKNIKRNAIILFIVTILILYFVLKDDFDVIVNNLLLMDIKWLIASVLLIFLYYLFKARGLYLIIREDTKKVGFKDIFQITLITQFFNGITPFASGGQPMEIYMLSKKGIKASKAANIILQNFIMYQVALIVYGVIAILLNLKFHYFTSVPFLRSLITIGFIVNFLVGVGLFLICFSNKFDKFVTNKLIIILSWLRIVKDRSITQEKWQKRVDEFSNSAKLLKENRSVFIRGIIDNFLGLGCFYAIPYFVIHSLDLGADITVIEAIVSSAYVLIMGAFVPIPGGSGGIEYGYMQFLGNFIKGSTLGASMLVWRFITYYIGIIIGAIMLNFFKGVKKDENRIV